MPLFPTKASIAYISLRLFAWILVLFTVTSCEESTRFLAVERVEGPAVADVLDLVAARAKKGEGPDLMARTFSRFWTHKETWKPTAEADSTPPFDFASIEDSGSGAWFQNHFWWTTSTPHSDTLIRSQDGQIWSVIDPPPANRTGLTSESTYEILSSGALVDSPDALYFVTPATVWKYDESLHPHWISVDLHGIDLKSDSQFAPKLIRNYLPATTTRKFEIATVFQNDLRIYRREVGSKSFYLVSTLPTFDRQILSSADGHYLFIVSPEGIYRSSDQGETWFRFWEPEEDSVVCAEYVEVVGESKEVKGSLLLVGTANGDLYRSETDGEQWQRVTVGEGYRRRIVKIVSSDDGSKIWLGILGIGVFLSIDQGETWLQDSTDFRSSRPFSIGVGGDDSFLMLDRGGFWRLPRRAPLNQSKEPTDSQRGWKRLSKLNVTAFTPILKEEYVVGTASGALLKLDQEGRQISYFMPNISSHLEPQGPAVRSEGGMISTHKDAVVFLRRRADGSEIQAWYRNGRVVSSPDEGKSWEPIEIPADTVAVFRDQEVLDVQLLGENSTLLLTESGMGTRHLWLSEDRCQSWMELEWRYPEAIRQIRVLQGGEVGGDVVPATLLVQATDKIYASRDHGISWQVLEGPWTSLSVVQMATHGTTLATLVDSRLGYELILAHKPFTKGVTYQRFPLSWPKGYPKDLPKLLVLGEDLAGVLSSERLWVVQVGIFERTVSRAVLVVSQLFVIILMTGVVFLVLRTRWRRRRRDVLGAR